MLAYKKMTKCLGYVWPNFILDLNYFILKVIKKTFKNKVKVV
jgi:hypothetical protein